jgi:hypothetical protein
VAGPGDALVLVGSSSAGKEGKKASEGAFVSKALVSSGGFDCVALAVDALRAAGVCVCACMCVRACACVSSSGIDSRRARGTWGSCPETMYANANAIAYKLSHTRPPPPSLPDFTNLSELEGGFTEWDLQYRPDGRRRERGNWADRSSGELEWWTASN